MKRETFFIRCPRQPDPFFLSSGIMAWNFCLECWLLVAWVDYGSGDQRDAGSKHIICCVNSKGLRGERERKDASEVKVMRIVVTR